MLGTGAAMVTKIYNTCFTLSDESGEHFLVDGGGGNGILTQLERAGIKIGQIHDVFVSHNHTDHILGLIWVIRYVAQEINKGRYEGNLNIYGHEKSLTALRTMATLLIQPKQSVLLDNRIVFNPIEHKAERVIGGRRYTFFNIWSTKELQHGFVVELRNGKRLAFLGDEPYNKENESIIRGSHIIMQEAYCRYAELDKYNPYPKHHGTVIDSCRNAKELGAETTILYHTEGRTPAEERKALYTAEGRTVYDGNLIVPDDLEVIEL